MLCNAMQYALCKLFKKIDYLSNRYYRIIRDIGTFLIIFAVQCMIISKSVLGTNVLWVQAG